MVFILLQRGLNSSGLIVLISYDPVVIIRLRGLLKRTGRPIKLDFCRQPAELSGNISVCIKSEKRDGYKSGAGRLCFFLERVTKKYPATSAGQFFSGGDGGNRTPVLRTSHAASTNLSKLILDRAGCLKNLFCPTAS